MNEIFELGRKYGIKECQRAHRHQWTRLFFFIIGGAFLGCSLALLLAFYLSNL